MAARSPRWAEELARKLLEVPLSRRWAHVQGVAAKARFLTPILGDDADLLEAAAWLHDIGYAPELYETGFHPLDGARYLRDVHTADSALYRLIAHHSEFWRPCLSSSLDKNGACWPIQVVPDPHSHRSVHVKRGRRREPDTRRTRTSGRLATSC